MRLLPIAAALALVACTPEEVVPTGPMALDGVAFTVEALPPDAATSACDPARPFRARVRWTVQDWADPKFDLHLRSTQGQLVARYNAPTGEHVTGEWAYAGLYVLLVDRNSRLLVAAAPVPPLACPAA